MVVIIRDIILFLNKPLFPGIMRMFLPQLPSSSASIGLSTTSTIAIAVILLACHVPIGNSQQLPSQPSATENGTATRAALSTEDSFRVQLPVGWIIQDVNNTGFTLATEVLQGYGVLALLCQEEQQQQQSQGATVSDAGANSSTSSESNGSCQGAREVIHIVRYPNLGARLGLASDDIISNDDVTADVVLAYQMQKLQEVGYRDIRIVNSTDTTINVDLGTALNNNTMGAMVPAKLVEMTYSTNLAPDETRRGYFISAATNVTPHILGLITGYGIFYEVTTAVAPAAAQDGEEQQTMMQTGSLLLLLPLTSVRQVFDSFELIAGAEVGQAILAAQAAQATEEEAVEDLLTVEIYSNGTDGTAPATFEFEADITAGTEPYTIRWYLDDDGIAESNEQTLVATFNEAGTYDTVLTVTDSEGQVASDSIEVTVEEEPIIEETTEEETSCDPSYPNTCIPPPPPNLTCDDVGASNFEVLPPDPHEFDGDNDGIGCESESNQQPDLKNPIRQAPMIHLT